MSLDEQDKQWISERLDASEARMREYVRDIETSLLRAFENWAKPREARQRAESARITALELEHQDHEDRLKKLEGRQ